MNEKNNGGLVGMLIKGAIIAAGTGLGLLLSKCVSVDEVSDGEVETTEPIDVPYEEVPQEETVPAE